MYMKVTRGNEITKLLTAVLFVGQIATVVITVTHQIITNTAT